MPNESSSEGNRLVQGEPLDALLQAHYAQSLRLARSILREPTEAEDAVQSAYGNALRHISGFREEARFSTWISRIVVNQCLMRLRQLRRTTTVSLADMLIEPSVPLFSSSRLAGPHEMFERNETAAAIKQALGRLPAPLRLTWMLHELEGLSMRDLSDAMGISVAAAKSRLFRARAELRTILTSALGARQLASAS